MANKLTVIVDGQSIPVQEQVIIAFSPVTGPVDGGTSDILQIKVDPTGAIKEEVWSPNSAGVTGVRKSHNNTTASAMATAANTAG